MSWTSLQEEGNKSQAPLEAGEALCEPVGEEVQRLSVVHSLPLLLSIDESQCMQRVLPKVQQVLPSASAEFHLAASSTFLTILEKKLVHPRAFTQTFLQSILSSIDSRDPVVASAWLETLLDVIELLPNTVIKSDILPIAIQKGQISQSVNARLIACKLLGRMSTRFEPYLIKKEVLPVIHSLCQDVNYEVRACICSQLHFVARSLDRETVKPSLLPCLVELASDEERRVRLEAVVTICNMICGLQPDTLKFTIVPLVKKMCEQSLRAEDIVMVRIAEQFGRLCLGLQDCLTPQEKLWMLRHYQKMAQLGLPSMIRMPDVVPSHTENYVACRQHCAFNFPAMTNFSITNKDLFNQQLYPIFKDLARDPYFMVRRTIASGLSEIISLLGPGSQILKSEIVKLLRDDAEEVLQGLVPRLGSILVQLSKAGAFSPESMDTVVLDFGRALLKCEGDISISTNWRLHAMVLGQMECLPHCMPCDFIHSHFVPVIFSRINLIRPVPCRMAAARTMLVFLRYTFKQSQKNEIRTRIDIDLRNSRSCHKRMLYVKMCATAIDLFSRRYFKDFFFTNLLDLSNDRVPNVRLKLVSLFPKLKAMLFLPGDRKLLTSLEVCVRSLLAHEKDRDVMSLLRRTIHMLDSVELRQESGGGNMTKEDIEDQRKAEEEAKLMSAGVSALSKRKPSPGPAGRRSVELKTIPSVPEKKAVSSSLSTQSAKTSPLPSRRQSVNNAGLRGSPITNLEDEFYVDAGIRIPQQLAASDFTPLPSRIPNLREILFKKQNTSNPINLNSQALCEPVSQKDVDMEFKPSSEPETGSLESKPDFNTAQKVVTKTTSTASKSSVSISVSSKKSFIPSNINKRNSGVFTAKVEYQSQPNSKGKASTTNKQKATVNVTTSNRRHSYMEGDKFVKIKSSEIVEGKRSSVVSESRRHSYLERVQVSTSDCGAETTNENLRKGSSQNQNSSETKLPINNVTNRRHSYNPLVQNNRSEDISVLKRGAASNRHSIGPEIRKSLVSSQSQIRRGTSLDRETGTDIAVVGSSVKRRSMITPTVKHTVRRHSSLERDDVDRLSVRTRVQGKKLENKFLSSNPQKELMIFSPTDRKTVNEKIDINKRDQSSSSQRDFHSLDDVGTSCKRGHTSKIPRGGGTSCHSSPGNSRASSPTILMCGSNSRLRQRTAPNSRASSPTGSEKLQQRLSLGSLNCYMGNLKLTEPGTSRLPIRTYSRPM